MLRFVLGHIYHLLLGFCQGFSLINPGHEHWVVGKKVLRYLQRTKGHMLVFRQVENLKLIGFSDSNFARNYPDSNKSTCGYVFYVSWWGSFLENYEANLGHNLASIMQVEFIAVYEAVCEGL